MEYRVASAKDREIVFPTPHFVYRLFHATSLAWVWLIVRLYLAYVWIEAGLEKLGDEAWMTTGVALKGFWSYAITVPEQGYPPIAYGWYRQFITYMLENEWYVWFAKLIVIGEVLVGVALLLGFFVGVSAFFGGFMNWNYIMAGSASSNGVLLMLSVLLILAWRVAGWYGLDRFLLPLLGAEVAPMTKLERSQWPSSAPSRT